MASVFISYVREDVDQARWLAAAFEQAGHSVWWDRHIKGGTQFATEIENALNAADKVVVLWSQFSISSAWVRDEAAAGRDTGRLIPVSIDATAAPLGFRQFQTILVHKGKLKGPELRELLEAIGGDTAPAATAAPGPLARVGRERRASHKVISNWWLASGAAALALVAIVGWWWSVRSSPHPPAVLFEGVDPQSASLSRQLAVKVGELQSSRGDAFQLISAGKPDLILQLHATDGPSTAGREVSMLFGNDRSVLWSASLQLAASKVDDLSQQLALATERALSCAGEAMAFRRERIDGPALRAYLHGCTRFDDAYGSNTYDPAVATAFEQVIATAPHFEPAWSKLFAVEIDGAPVVDDTPAMLRKIGEQVRQAQTLGIDIPEIYAAKAARLPQGDFAAILRTYDEGLGRYPNSALLYRLRGERKQYVGRMSDAVADAGRAVQIDPMSPANRQTLASLLAYAGNFEGGYEQLRKAEQLWPNSPTVIDARYRLDLRYGDPAEALSIYQKYLAQVGIGSGQIAFIEARMNPTADRVERAISEERKGQQQLSPFISSYVQALGQFGRKDEAIDVLLHYDGGDMIGYNAEVLFRPAMHDVWRDPRSMAAAAHLGLLRYWRTTGNWPDFCFDPTLPYDCKKEAAKYS